MLFIVPSRNRPANVEALIGAWDQTRVIAKLLIVVDQEDALVGDYRKILRYAPDWVAWRVTSTTGMVAALNRYATTYAWTRGQHPAEDIIGFMGDDHRPRTYGWDALIDGAMKRYDGAVVYGNDLLQGANLPTHVALPARWVRALGYMAPPTFKHLYVDNYWKTLGEKLDRLCYLDQCVIEHMHPVAGKAAWDDGYRRVNDGTVYADDAAEFARLLNEGHIGADVVKVTGLGM